MQPLRRSSAWAGRRTAARTLIAVSLSAVTALAVAVALPSAAQAATGAIKGGGAGRCVDLPGSNATNGSQLEIWDCNGGSNQNVTSTSSKQLQILGKCLDDSGYGQSNGTKVVLWDCSGTANQQWNINSNGTITSVYAGLCLDVTGAGTANGTLLQLWACNGQTNQQWSGIGATGGGGSTGGGGGGSTTPPSTGSLNSRFRGMNWADINDNFQSGLITPNGLSNTSNATTVYNRSKIILQSFKTNFSSNTVRLGINPATVNSSWWTTGYGNIIKAANDLGMNVDLGNWGPQSSQFQIPDMNAYWSMWDKVIAQYKGNSSIYFEPFNEPGNQSNWVSVAEQFVSRYSGQVDKGRMFIDGTGWAENAQPIGSDSKLNGTIISIHVYSLFGRSHTTYNDWVNDFKNSLSSYGSRVVVTEFGVPADGTNYNGARDGNNNVSYLYAVTDLIRQNNSGAVYWDSVNPHDGLSLETETNDYTTFKVSSQSALDRLKYALHL